MQIQTRDGWNSSVLVFQSSSIPNSCSLNLLFLPTSGPKCLNHLKSTPCIPICFAVWNPEVFLLKSLQIAEIPQFSSVFLLKSPPNSSGVTSWGSWTSSASPWLRAAAARGPRAASATSRSWRTWRMRRRERAIDPPWTACRWRERRWIHGDSWRKRGWNGLEMVGDGWGPTFWSEEMRTWFKYKMDIIPQLKVESWNPSMGATWCFWKAWNVETCFQSLVWKVRRLRAQQSWPPCIGVENYWCRDMQSTWPPKIRLEGTCSFFGVHAPTNTQKTVRWIGASRLMRQTWPMAGRCHA